ncbi:ABC transporter ATP-binding protein [Neptuniibacter halophilus]|uniref:ABC transporter ATP-binding protein n=1 Tax=Neptuniibacter halophilus TaxID=651666 RepID=UPI0025722823|nr:ABC transporter ATP-binding protein [Neptuniibacter halophilus]
MSIRVESLSFSYGPRQALSDISFELSPGSFNALLGPNGAGKSTLFSLITRLNALQSGDISIDNLSIRKQPAGLMRRIGVVFQQSTLDLDLTVRQNLLYHASLHGIDTRTAEQKIDAELNRMQMTERANDKVRKLNGGHRRRVEIARALLHEPEILLLDEPTVGLDPQTRRSLNQYVRGLCLSQNLTVLWATHLMEEVQPDDPVILLHQGRILICDQAQAMLNSSGADNLTDAFHQLTGIQEAS